jgi:hypothetical protein
MKVILVARKALAAYLISSLVRRRGEQDRRFVEEQRPIDLAHHLAPEFILGADDDAVGPLEIADGRALAQEFGVGDDGELVARSGLADDPFHLVAGAHRHGRLGDDHRIVLGARPPRARLRRRRSDRHGHRRGGWACRPR